MVSSIRTSVLGLPVDVLTVKELLPRVAELAQSSTPRLVCYLNAECMNQAVFDRRYRAILHDADLVYADGAGVVWASRLTNNPLPERITLGDVLPEVCRLAVARGLRVFLLGSQPGVAERAAARLTRRFPGLQIVGTRDGYLGPGEEQAVIDQINAAKPHLLLAGMGVPRQEKWLWQHRHELRVPILWGVGALFEYYAGTTPRAPVWMRRTGLEWLFRLWVEPRRLWQRYLLGNAFFILRTLALLLIDAALVTAAWLGAYGICRWLDQPFGVTLNSVEPYLEALALCVAIWLVTCASFGLYRRSQAMSVLGELAQVIRATWVGFLSTMAVAFLFRELSLGRPVVVLFGGLTFVLLTCSRLVTRAVERRLARRGIGLRRVLIVGTGRIAKRLKEEIEIWPVGYEVVGFVSDGDGHGTVKPAELVGSVHDLSELIARHQVEDVFVASQHLKLHQELELLAERLPRPVNFHVVNEELEGFAQRVPLDRVVALPLLQLPPARVSRWYDWSKRGFDALMALLVLAACLPFFAVISLAILLESPGAVLFAQRRVGRGGRHFRMLKFRTMRRASRAYALSPNSLQDPRITHVGRLLRRWSLDELPQLFNVLKGDMSLVGPRPEMPFLVRRYTPWQRARLSVRPGLTGLWQVVGRKDLPLHRNVEYDLYYVRHRGWMLDLAILLRTLPAVFSRRGAY